MKKVIIIGASSGIGKELSIIMAQNGYLVGLVARRDKLLKEISKDFPDNTLIKKVDINSSKDTIKKINDLISKMKGADIIVISAGIGLMNEEFDFKKEIQTIKTNVKGFTIISNIAYKYFIKRKQGHLVAITSVAAIRGSRQYSAYSASKAFQSNYLEGLRRSVFHLKLPITITEIQPGYVDTAMIQGQGSFWVLSPQNTAKQIFKAIVRKKEFLYISKRWRLVGWFLKIIPSWFYKRM